MITFDLFQQVMMDVYRPSTGRSCRLYLAPLLLVFLAACSGSPDAPFSADPREGTFRFLAGEGGSAGMKIVFNQVSLLRDAVLYNDRGRLLCINTVDGVDMVATFVNASPGGSVTVTMINTTDERREVKSFELVTLSGNGGLTAGKTGDGGMEFTEKGEGRISWNISPAANACWPFYWETGDNNISLLLQQGDIPVILLPGEELHLPPVLFH